MSERKREIALRFEVEHGIPQEVVEMIIGEYLDSQPASAPSEQKPVAWLNPVNGSVISDSHRIYLLENYPRNKCEHVEPLYLAPQTDYKAQRDELMEVLGIAQATINCAGISTPKIVCDAVEKYAAIASVKGGE